MSNKPVHPHVPPSLTVTPSKSSSMRNVDASHEHIRETEAEDDAKRRKVQRACDVCRRKKIKCEGPMTSASASKCLNCQENGFACTYVEAAKRRGPPRGYVDMLEQRLGRHEQLLKQLHPGVNFETTVGPHLDRDNFDLDSYKDILHGYDIPPYPSTKPFSMPVSAVSTPTPVFPSCQGSGHTEINKDDAELHMEMAEAMNHLDVKDEQWRFHGRASGAHLVRDVNDLKYGRDHFERGMNPFLANLKTTKRDQYWQVPEWEVVIATEGLQPIDSDVWPSSNLAQTLIDAYFDFVNVYYPLLNRIIFQQQYDSGLYHGNHDFARVCLMVFANGSRFVEDHRVYWPVEVATTDEGRERMRTDKDGTLKYSAGWKYLRATFRMGKSWIIGPSLPELQCTVLVCAFLMGSSVPHLTWLASGAGLRSAQELGIHVRSTLHNADPIERALYNRAFWCLYHIDRINCAAIGRSVGLQDGDFDVELPVAIADQYWGNPSQQPEGSIPVISAFIHMLKLDHVIGAALRTVYSIRTDSSNIEARRAVVVELDTGLNSWVDSVPDGLRWDPARQDQTLFEQSAMLYAHYYYCQILVHRPFIPTPRQPETVGFPSLAICSNAARSITNVVDAVLRRGRTLGNLPGRAINVTFLLPTLTAAIVLLVGVYTGKQQPYEREKALSDVRRCISVVREIEQCWRQAGKMTDMLVELSRDVDLPTDSPPPPLQGVKRSNEHLLEPLVEQQWQPPVPSPLFSQPFIDPMNQMPALDMNPFEAFQATYGGVANFDLPGQSDDDVDLWSQLFGGYSAPVQSWYTQPP